VPVLSLLHTHTHWKAVESQPKRCSILHCVAVRGKVFHPVKIPSRSPVLSLTHTHVHTQEGRRQSAEALQAAAEKCTLEAREKNKKMLLEQTTSADKHQQVALLQSLSSSLSVAALCCIPLLQSLGCSNPVAAPLLQVLCCSPVVAGSLLLQVLCFILRSISGR